MLSLKNLKLAFLPKCIISDINFWQWNDGLFKKMKKLSFLASDFDKCRKEKKFEFNESVKYGERYFDSERLWWSKLSLLKLRAAELATLGLKSLWKSIKMRTFDMRYEHGWIFHRSLVKAVKNRQSKQMKNWKLAF